MALSPGEKANLLITIRIGKSELCGKDANLTDASWANWPDTACSLILATFSKTQGTQALLTYHELSTPFLYRLLVTWQKSLYPCRYCLTLLLFLSVIIWDPDAQLLAICSGVPAQHQCNSVAG